MSAAWLLSAASRIWRTFSTVTFLSRFVLQNTYKKLSDDFQNKKKLLLESFCVILLDFYLQSVVGENVEVWSREKIKTVFRRHGDVTIINVPQKGVKTLSGGNHFSNTDFYFVVRRWKGAEHSLKIWAPKNNSDFFKMIVSMRSIGFKTI